MAEPLELDMKKYQELLPSLLEKEGKYALIFKGDLKGVFEAYSDALAEGYQLAGLEPFLVKRIARTEVISYFTRVVGAECRT